MRGWLLVLALIVAAPFPAAAQQLGPPWATPLANEFWSLRQERQRAYLARDRAFYERLLADEFVLLGGDAALIDRAHYLDGEFPAGAGPRAPQEIAITDFTARRSGALVLVSYDEAETVHVGDQDFVQRSRRIDTYVRQHGRWRLAAMTAVAIPEAPAAIAVSAEQLADYIGVYQYGPGLTSTLSVENGQLAEQTTDQPPGVLIAIAPDTFYAPADITGRISFERDATGLVTAQIYRSGSQILRAPKVR